MHIIIILGLPLSGKTTHVNAINEKNIFDFQIPLHETGKYVLEVVRNRGLDTTPDNIKEVIDQLKKERGDAFLTEMLVKDLKNIDPKPSLVAISGIKSPTEAKLLQNEFAEENVVMVSFHASFTTRYSRLFNKDRKEMSQKIGKNTEDEAMTSDPSKLKLRDEKELEYGLGRLISLADYVVNTDDQMWPYNTFENSLEDFKGILESLLNTNS